MHTVKEGSWGTLEPLSSTVAAPKRMIGTFGAAIVGMTRFNESWGNPMAQLFPRESL